MLTAPARLFARLATVALPMAILYAAFGKDRTGVALLVGLFLVAALTAMAAVATRENETTAPVGPDAPPPALRELDPPPLPSASGAPATAALALALLVASPVLGSGFAAAAVALGLFALVWWSAANLGEQRGRPVNLLPVGVPLVVLFVIVAIVFFMSRMLLAVSETSSWVIALVVAVVIFAAAAAVAARPAITASRLVTLLALLGLFFVVGGVAGMAVGPRDTHKAHSAGGDPVRVESTNSTFDKKEFELHAEQQALMTFKNNDTVPHNVAIYATEEGTGPVYRGDIITGPSTIDYRFKAPKPGHYYFRCDVHPNMKGTVTVA